MDPTKLKVLREAGYKISPSCGICIHFRPGTSGDRWGTCAVHEYRHETHSGPPRKMSCNVLGRCTTRFFLDVSKARDLFGSFDAFVVAFPRPVGT